MFEVFFQILIGCTEVDILDEHASLVAIILSWFALAHIVSRILLLLRCFVVLIYVT